MLKDFYEGTTLAFDAYVYMNGLLQDISADSVFFIMKKLKTDSDAEAVISAQAFDCSANGVAQFEISATETEIEPRNYYYELKWVSGTKVYILESGEVRVLDRIFDV